MYPVKSTAGFHLQGETGKLIELVTKRWLIGLRESNPAILDMFHERDKKPHRLLLPWSGEFAGKYLTGAYYIYRLTADADLFAYIQTFIEELLTCVDEEGYVGCYAHEFRLTGNNPNARPGEQYTWDAWNHYHILFGLYLWYKETGRDEIWQSILRTAELFLRTFYAPETRRLVDIGCAEMNLSPLHIFAILYKETRDERYRRFCEEILRDLDTPEAGGYLTHALNGGEFFQCRRPRWESLHIIMGFVELYDGTGQPDYLKAAQQIFNSLMRTDVHNTGGFSTGEQAIGNPFENGPIELCCTIACNALGCELFLRTGDLRIADFLEKSFYNAVLGSFSPSGKWSTYNTPMEGVRIANYDEIGFQCRPGSPDLNCCSVNAARGLGMLSEWAFTKDDEALYIHLFESCRIDDDDISLEISGSYPEPSTVYIQVQCRRDRRVFIRIPSWSVDSHIITEEKEYRPAAGEYWEMPSELQGTKWEFHLDFTPTFLAGGGACAGKKSVFYGPVLYGYDAALNVEDYNDLPILAKEELMAIQPKRRADGRLVLETVDGLVLSDFYRLGVTGSTYTTWLKIE